MKIPPLGGQVSSPSSTGKRRYSRSRGSRNGYPKFNGQRAGFSRSKQQFSAAFMINSICIEFTTGNGPRRGKNMYSSTILKVGRYILIGRKQTSSLSISQAILSNSTAVPAQFSVPLRPRLFGKPERSTLHLARVALEEDEVFMILVFIYSEVKRQDRTVCLYFDNSNVGAHTPQNSSSANGGLGW
jgi:hypothetical protein